MTYLLSALAGILILASWVLIVALIVTAHHSGMERVRKAEQRWTNDVHAARQRHPSARLQGRL